METSIIDEIELLMRGEHSDPHRILGRHDGVAYLLAQGMETLSIEVDGQITPMEKVHEGGLFALKVGTKPYRIYLPDGTLIPDPYTYLPTFPPEDAALFAAGNHERIYEVMGARVTPEGVKFSVWAPNAKQLHLVGDFNKWNELSHPMRLLGETGIWEFFIPGLKSGEKYKFLVRTAEGHIRYKADPYALQGEMRPNTASLVTKFGEHPWEDRAWMERRTKEGPLNIYEVHLGSWRQGEGDFPNYREVAPRLADYCKEMGFTHVELLPIMGHPMDESWRYQVTGFYAISRLYGTLEDFQYFVDHLHQNGIGVILD